MIMKKKRKKRRRRKERRKRELTGVRGGRLGSGEGKKKKGRTTFIICWVPVITAVNLLLIISVIQWAGINRPLLLGTQLNKHISDRGKKMSSL